MRNRPRVPSTTRLHPHTPRHNAILGSQAVESGMRFGAMLQPVELEFGTVLYRRGVNHVYFPVDCVVSLLAAVKHHLPVECGIVGSEGMVGVPAALGIRGSRIEAVVHGSGRAMRMDATSFARELRNDAALRARVDRYIHLLMSQIAQTAVCNIFHTIEARCARWLLMTRERAKTDELDLTQEFLAQMLGVRRVGVTAAAGSLREQGLIAYSRGRIRILDAERLREQACECYRPMASTDDRPRSRGTNPRVGRAEIIGEIGYPR